MGLSTVYWATGKSLQNLEILWLCVVFERMTSLFKARMHIYAYVYAHTFIHLYMYVHFHEILAVSFNIWHVFLFSKPPTAWFYIVKV